jgi:hypothetical protein
MHYRGRQITPCEIANINGIIEQYPKLSRSSLSKQLCETWDWRQTNGILKDMTCRGLLLWLERQGQIKLPARKYLNYQHLLKRKRPEKIEIDETPLEGKISDIGLIELRQIRGTDFEKIFDGMSSVSEQAFLPLRFRDNPWVFSCGAKGSSRSLLYSSIYAFSSSGCLLNNFFAFLVKDFLTLILFGIMNCLHKLFNRVTSYGVILSLYPQSFLTVFFKIFNCLTISLIDNPLSFNSLTSCHLYILITS